MGFSWVSPQLGTLSLCGSRCCSSTKVRQGNLARRIYSTDRQQLLVQPLLHLISTHMKTKLYIYYICVKRTRSSLSVFFGFSLWDPQVYRLVVSVGHPKELLSCSGPQSIFLFFFFFFLIKGLKLHPLFRCMCLHLSESTTRWRPSEFSHVRLLSASIMEYH